MGNYSCQYCNESFGNAGAKGSHEISCDGNPDNSNDFTSCQFCGKKFQGGKRVVTGHERHCVENPNSLKHRIPFICSSAKCDEIGIYIGKYQNFQKKEVRFCSKFCSRSYATQGKREEINEQVSETLSGRSLPDSHPMKNTGLFDYVSEEKRLEIISKIRESDVEGFKIFTCPVCGSEQEVSVSSTRKFCSKECYMNSDSFGNGIGERGYYKGDYYHSSWELAFAVYHEDHHIPFERVVDEEFSYQWKGGTKTYTPDFKYHGEHYVEVKGYKIAKDQAKWDHFPHKLEVLREEEMTPMIDYVESEYGENFWEVLYN
jgi:transcription elongation factor Elf1